MRLDLLVAYLALLVPMLHAFQAGRVVAHARQQGRRLLMSSNGQPISHQTAFLFPGQGAQSVGMSKTLYETLPAAKALFDRASEILGYSLIDKCVNGPKNELDSTAVSQPAIFVSSMAALEKLKVENAAAVADCTVAMGLSLGEYSALCFAGAFSFEDGVRLTKARGEAMQHAADLKGSGMVAVLGLDKDTVRAVCEEAAALSGEPVAIANFLAPGNYAVSGGKKACAVAADIAKGKGSRMTVPLAVAGAFHTQYMQPAVDRLREALYQTQIVSPRVPVVSNVDAAAHHDPNDIRETLLRQVTSPVQWETIMENMLKDPTYKASFEIGPGTVCKGIVKRIDKKLDVVSVSAN